MIELMHSDAKGQLDDDNDNMTTLHSIETCCEAAMDRA